MTATSSYHLIDDVVIAQNTDEIEALERFRYSVYVQEQGKQVEGADHGQSRLRLPSDDEATHYYLRDESRILGYARGHFGVFPEHLQGPLQLHRFDRFCARDVLFYSSQLMVAPQTRNLAVMRALTGGQYRDGRRRGIRAWLFHCQADLAPIYLRAGLHRYGPDFNLPHVGRQSPFIGICEDVDWFRACKSYFYPLTQEYENRDDFLLAFRNEFTPERKL